MKKHRRPIAHEVAEASRALQSEIVQTRSTNELLATAHTWRACKYAARACVKS